VRKPEPIEWEETEVKGPPEEAAPTPPAEEEQPGLTAH
jgi:hypothetical protein